jgi:hypothetical protein
MAGDQGAIEDSAKRGWALFNGKGRMESDPAAVYHLL